MAQAAISPEGQGEGARPSIFSMRVLNCGRAEQHREHRFGSALPALCWVFFGRDWVPVPLQAFLIEHRDGWILFDTGIDPAIVSDRAYIRQAIGRFLLPRLFRLHVTEDDRLDRVLARAGVAAGDISTAILSHLHFDHVGGIGCIPQADLLVSAREWAILSEPHPERDWILREHIDLPGARWRPIVFELTEDPLFAGFDGVHDVMGVGSLIALPTPGHTPGSLSLLIRRQGWNPILLIGDLAYQADMLDRGRFSGTGDRAQLRGSYARVRALRDRLPGLAIIASHDGAAADLLQQAMQGGQRGRGRRTLPRRNSAVFPKPIQGSIST